MPVLLLCSLVSFTQVNSKRSLVFFENNETQLDEVNRKLLNAFYYRNIEEKVVEEIIIIGHADSLGAQDYNLHISKKRAVAVKEYLISIGCNSDVVNFDFKGETKPIYSGDKDRCVELKVTYKANYSSESKQEKEAQSAVIKFENDTTLVFEKGAKIEIAAETFYPIKISDVNFEVTEIYSLCDMLNNNTTTRTVDGDCLTSAGMIYIKATYDGVEIQPNNEKYVRVKIPALEGEIDTSMSIYAAVKNDCGETVWESIESKLSYEKNGEKYFLFDTDTLYDFNLDKSIGVLCEKSGPIIKVPKYDDVYITQLYPCELYLAIADKKAKSKYVLDELKFDMHPYLIVIAYDKDGFPLIAEGNLDNLKYRKRKNIYVVKKKYFRNMPVDFTIVPSSKDYMCEYLNSMKEN